MAESADDDEFRRLFQEFMEKLARGEIGTPEQSAAMAQNPALMAQVMGFLQQMAGGTGTDPWAAAAEQAGTVAAQSQLPVTDEERAGTEAAFRMAALWLSEQTEFADPSATGGVMNRTEWVRETMPAWREIALPLSDSLVRALTASLAEQAPEALGPMLQGATDVVRRLSLSLFTLQLGAVVGRLSQEVVTANEIGVPVLADGRAALLPQNVAEFARGLDIPSDQVAIYLATRELAHASLFRSARWLTLRLSTAIREYGAALEVDIEGIQDRLTGMDPSDPSSLQEAIAHGDFIVDSEAKKAALERIGDVLALVEGWVDTVTAAATARLPKSAALAETMNRRRATGGPAEQAFGALLALELRPRRLREAAALWTRIGDELGAEARDALWGHPDLIPTSADLDDPDACLRRLRTPQEPDDMDRDLQRLLDGGFDGDANTGEDGDNPAAR